MWRSIKFLWFRRIFKKKTVYGDWVKPTQKDFTATISFTIDDIDEKEQQKILQIVPLFKRYVMMTPFTYSFDLFLKQKPFDPISISYRREESIYIIYYEKEKSLIVIYSIKFDDEDDNELGRIFLQEFKDSRRDRELGSSPSVSFTQGQKPLELTSAKFLMIVVLFLLRLEKMMIKSF